MITHVANNVFRGSRPKSFADLIPFKIFYVLNLESGIYKAFTNTQYENEHASDFGMEEIDIPCSDITPPSVSAIRNILEITEKGKKEHHNVYIHCLHGQDRTGYVCAVYRMKICGWPYKQAVDEMMSFGFHKWPYLPWLLCLRKFGKGEEL